MGRPRKYANQAERQKAARDRKRGRPARPYQGDRAAHAVYDFQNLEFITLDGEGEDIPNTANPDARLAFTTVRAPDRHIYTLLMCSDGHYLENPNGLETLQIFDWLLDLRQRYPGRGYVFCGFSLGYDCNMWLADLPEYARVRLANQGSAYVWLTDTTRFRIEFKPSKYFVLSKHLRQGPDWRTVATIRVTDVFGFFQKSFVAALEEWHIGTPDQIDRIKRMKALRGQFHAISAKEERDYCREECQLLADLMKAFRDALGTAGLYLKAWHGAGAIAAYLLRREGVKAHIRQELPEPVDDAVMRAYFGGRVQLVQAGLFRQVWQHDLNSAYPSQMQSFPSLAGVRIVPVKAYSDHPWAIWRVRWSVPQGSPIGPLPWRAADGSVLWPRTGQGWYWAVEVAAARECFGKQAIRVLEGYLFHPRSDEHPFGFIPALYQERLRLKYSDDPRLKSAEVPLKLGLNSLYGKTAEGSYQDRRPPHQSYIYAGMTTAGCRAAMLRLAMRNPDAVIAFATDGLFSRRQLAETTPGLKPLGGWEVETIDEMFALQPGMMWLRDQAGNIRTKSRGFNKRDLIWDDMLTAWRKRGFWSSIRVTVRKFIGLKYAAGVDNWDLWLRWVESYRTIRCSLSELTINENVDRPRLVYTTSAPPLGSSQLSAAYLSRHTSAGAERSKESALDKELDLDNIDGLTAWELDA